MRKPRWVIWVKRTNLFAKYRWCAWWTYEHPDGSPVFKDDPDANRHRSGFGVNLGRIAIWVMRTTW